MQPQNLETGPVILAALKPFQRETVKVFIFQNWILDNVVPRVSSVCSSDPVSPVIQGCGLQVWKFNLSGMFKKESHTTKRPTLAMQDFRTLRIL